MYYPDELVEEIREKNDIVSVVGEYVKLTRKGGSYFGLCPFHNEKTGSFSVSPQKQMYYCFGCHKGGNVFSFLMDYENYTFPEAVKVLGERVGVELPEVEYSEAQKQQKDEKTRMLEMRLHFIIKCFVLSTDRLDISIYRDENSQTRQSNILVSDILQNLEKTYIII